MGRVFLIAALGADDTGICAVSDGDVIPEKVAECNVVPTVEFEFATLELLDYLPEFVCVLICFLLFLCHVGPLKAEKATQG